MAGSESAVPVGPDQPAFYAGLQTEQILDEYDGPVLFLATDPSSFLPEFAAWLIAWRTGGARSAKSPGLQDISGVERWLAVPVSQRRRAQLLDEHVSLREAILLAEGPVYLLEGEPLHPASVNRVHPEHLDAALLPKGDVTVFGNSSEIPSEETGMSALRVLIHLVPGPAGLESPPVAVSSAVQESLQRFVSWSSRALLSDRFRPDERVPSVIPADDWAGMTMIAAKPGTLTIVVGTSLDDKDRREAVLDSLRKLKSISQGRLDPDALAAIGPRSTDSLLALTDIMRFLHLSVALKWTAGGTEEFAMVTESAAERTHDLLLRLTEEREPQPRSLPADLVVHLTESEAAELLKPVDAQRGGFQALIATLQGKMIGNDLLLTPYLVERVIRYVQDYGKGTFEDRLLPVYRAIHRYGLSFVGIR